MRKKDGSFPMESASSDSSSACTSGEEFETADYRHAMCGQGAWNKLKRSPLRRNSDQTSLMTSPGVCKKQGYDQMPLDQSPMDDIYSPERTKFAETNRGSSVNPPKTSHRGARSQNDTVYAPQFNVEKAQQHKAKPPSPHRKHSGKSHHHLPAVDEDDTAGYEPGTEEDAPGSGLSSTTEALKRQLKRKDSLRGNSASMDGTKEEHIESMVVSMQEIILLQEENLKTLSCQNEQYREKLSLFQDHILVLKKEQLNDKNEIHKLNFERESLAAETLWLREELKAARVSLANAKNSNEERGSSSSRKPTVSFHERPEVLGNTMMQGRDDEPTREMRRSRSKERSVFNKSGGSGGSSSNSHSHAQTQKHPISTHHKDTISGRCSDMEELQKRASILRETVTKMKLSQAHGDTPHVGQVESEDTRDDDSAASNNVSFDSRRREGLVRFKQSKVSSSYSTGMDALQQKKPSSLNKYKERRAAPSPSSMAWEHNAI